ncbi:hypothetical protein U9M48_039759 [Paspalum notatum var. saurae]|uniref:Transposase n=1 Tax=Paspalum notatum var. saurae TaxID=547442 RepID=A0AAQ3UQW4_PASNO
MDCPPWIDPGNAFRFIIKSSSYKANLEYGMLDMQEQEHEHWIDITRGYSMQDLIDDMATKIIWGSSQELQVWGVDTESGSEWRVRDNAQFQRMIECRLDVRVMKLTVDVIDKEVYKKPVSSLCIALSTHDVSVVTGAVGESGTVGVNDNLIVVQYEANDGESNALVDEAEVYEAMGFEIFDNEAAEKTDQEYAIPAMSAEIDNDFREAAIPVDDNEVNEQVVDWDRDNPDMAWAIIHEFELGTEKSDRSRFRGFCKAKGCPWKIIAKTQGDSSVRGDHSCASAIRVVGKMASQAWVAERCIPLLKEKKSMGAKEVKVRLPSKYKIDIPYQTMWYGRQRVSDFLFGKWEYSYDWLYRFKAEVELRSPGSVVEIGTETINGKKHFSKFFCCFKACIDGFIEGCRPYLSIDSTTLNGMWNGHMPACAIDGHNWLFPVAFGLFDSETKENWIWFMEQLWSALGTLPHLAICTDVGKGLIEAVKKVFPWVEHRECFRHLMENMKKNFSETEYAKYMWPAARAYTPEKHKYLLDKVMQNTPGLQGWLEMDHSLLWTRSKFAEQIKCDYINNNLAEA